MIKLLSASEFLNASIGPFPIPSISFDCPLWTIVTLTLVSSSPASSEISEIVHLTNLNGKKW